MTEPVDTSQLDALVAAHFVGVEGRRLDEVFDRILDFAAQPVTVGDVLQLEDYFGIGVHAPQDHKAPAPPRDRWTASVDFGRSIGLTDAEGDFAGLISNRIDLDDPARTDRPLRDGSPRVARLSDPPMGSPAVLAHPVGITRMSSRPRRSRDRLSAWGVPRGTRSRSPRWGTVPTAIRVARRLATHRTPGRGG